DVMVPVEWIEEKRSREKTRLTLQRARAALEAERAMVIFPSGRLARKRRGLVADEPWAPSALALARKYDAPLVPAHLKGPHNTLFHLFDRFSKELRDITLFHELLNKERDRFALTIGPAIAPERLEGDASVLTERLKRYIERDLVRDPDRPFA
ncbi:MAG TPA: 1-acyl-sn-glycerol-3-phosphate acyltransferase, partial [Caulobacteraceae bacterium]|nr:1-acyl-sn-glycerol-3-phosphate acyltransferase [Caulobacteraceae bacterium]